MAELIEMPFGLWAWIGPRDCVLDGGPDPRWERGNFGERGTHCKVCGHSAITCAKTAEPIVMPFGLPARSGARNHELDGVPQEGEI